MQTNDAGTERVDPRATRSAQALRRAILQLADRQPIGSITVDQVVDVAHVSRKTFYNHVDNPTELLAQSLTEELDEVRGRMDEGLLSGTSDLASLSRARLGEIVDHILRRRTIYQQPDGRIHPQLYRLLSDHFYAAIRFSIAQSHRHLPAVAVGHESAVADIHASYVAHAYAGAIDSWLPHADTIDREVLLTVIIGSLPDWMTTRGP